MTKNPLFFVIMFVSCLSFAQQKQEMNNTSKNSTDELLSQYVQSKGSAIIVFDASNIKQFWTDKSITSKSDCFEIVLKKTKDLSFESIPLKLQLINVNEAQDCRIDVISETDGFSFTVLNDRLKDISSSKMEDSFINLPILSSNFHLEDTNELSFSLKFNSKEKEVLSIKKIILSFANNKDSAFLASPGKVSISNKLVRTRNAVTTNHNNAFSVTGKGSQVFLTKKIIVDNNVLSTTLTIKNIGNNATQLYIGYIIFSKSRIQLDSRNYPFDEKILKVISAEKGSNRIIVDSCPRWKKNFYIALNAQENLSDIPNTSLLGPIVDLKEIDNGHAEITLSTPLNMDLDKDQKIRIHGGGGSFLYTDIKTLQPGEEQTFSSSIGKDDSFLQYSQKAFSHGVYSVTPLILSYSQNEEDNTILISNYSISY